LLYFVTAEAKTLLVFYACSQWCFDIFSNAGVFVSIYNFIFDFTCVPFINECIHGIFIITRAVNKF